MCLAYAVLGWVQTLTRIDGGRDIWRYIWLAHALQMMYLGILTRFLSFPSLCHICGYVRHASGVCITYTNNVQSDVQSELGLGIDPVHYSACVLYMLRRCSITIIYIRHML